MHIVNTMPSYRKRFWFWILVYMATVLVFSFAFNANAVPQWLVVPLALVPMIPAVFAGLASVDGFRAKDELERKISSEGILFSFFITAIVTFSYGFLETYAHFPKISMFFVWPVLAIGWCVGAAIAARRYR